MGAQPARQHEGHMPTQNNRAARRASRPRLEAGVAPTEQTSTELPVAPEPTPEQAPEATEAPQPVAPVAVEAPTSKANRAVLMGPELAEVRARNDAVDGTLAVAKEYRTRAASYREDANRIEKEAISLERAAALAQDALTAYNRRLLEQYDLDPDYVYTIDLDRGAIVAKQPR